MKKNFGLLVLVIVLFGCKKNSANTVSNSNSTVPIGTAIKYEAIGAPNLYVSYWDMQQNAISGALITSGWNYSFNTTKENQFINLSVTSNSGTNVTARIYVNGIVKKEGTGSSSVSVTYP